MARTLVTAPTEHPLSLSDLKEHLRVDGSDSDSELVSLLDEATNYVESMTGRRMITQTWKLVMDGFKDSVVLPYPPLQSVSSITYQDASDATQTLASTNYTVDTDSEPARVAQSATGTYPSTYDDLNAVTITFVCGYGGREDVPEELKRAIKLYAQWAYDMDEKAEAPLDHIIGKWRIPWFAQDV
ncbi:MAG: head-tail connector protein [bacterium]